MQAILAVQGVRTLTDPNALPTVIANAVTLVHDPKAAVQNVPQDLLNAVKTILSIPQQAASDAASTVNAFFSQLNFPGKLLPTPNGKSGIRCVSRYTFPCMPHVMQAGETKRVYNSWRGYPR